MSEYDKGSVPAGESATGPFPNGAPAPRFGRFNPKSRLSIASLARQLPAQAGAIAKLELAQVKQEMSQKAIKGGAAVGLFAVVAFFGVSLWAVLLTAAILGLNTVFAPWLSALLVAAVLLLVMVIAALVAITLFKRMHGVMPAESIASLKADVNALKGQGKYE